MPKQFVRSEDRARAIVALLAAQGPMSISAIAREIGAAHSSVERVIRSPLFEPSAPGSNLRYQLSETGRAAAGAAPTTQTATPE